MDNPRIEAAARAICRANGQNPDEPDYDFLTDCAAGHAWRGYIPHATAALAAADAAAWRPISEVPKDGRACIIRGRGNNIWVESYLEEWSFGLGATHFCELPPPPQPDTAEVG